MTVQMVSLHQLLVVVVCSLTAVLGTPYAVQGDGPPFPCSSYSDPALYGVDGLPTFRPLIIGHRGASGMYPEHTALSYREAARQGADLIECDLAITKDHKFICAHEPYLNLTTNVAQMVNFKDRLRTYNMDDDDDNFDWNDKGNITDWFSFDFTLEELKTLKKKQANEERDPQYDWNETVVTLDELVEITREYGQKQGRAIGIYPELKHSHAINKILSTRPGEDKKFEDHALQQLETLGFKSESDPCYLQAFEISSLEYVRNKTQLNLVFLLEQNITNKVWARLDALNLKGIGVDKGGLVTPGYSDSQGRGHYQWDNGPTDFLKTVHQHGLKAHGFTFRNEWRKLYWEHGQDPYSQLEEFYDLGIDGYFSDFPLTIRRFLNYKGVLCSSSSTTCLPSFLLMFAILKALY